MSYSKHEFACIPIAAIHIIRVLYTMGTSYLIMSSFCVQFFTMKTANMDARNFNVNNYVIVMVHLM